MKTKIIGMLVCMLLIVSMAIPISALNKDYEPSVKPTGKSADVPVWEVGDSWTYDVVFYQNNTGPNLTLVYTLDGEYVLTVIDDTGDSYTLEGIADRLFGSVDLGLFGLKATRFMTASTELRVRKADLGLEFWNQNLKGILLLMIGPITLPIPLQVEANVDVEFNPTWVITPFPLTDGQSGTFDDTELIHTNSYLSLFWGLIPVSEGGSAWHTGEIPYSVTEEQITVEAGTFDVYYITGDLEGGTYHDYYRTYYAPEVGNTVKESINIDKSGTMGETYYGLDFELKSTTYEP
jgi:hypothetical protein